MNEFNSIQQEIIDSLKVAQRKTFNRQEFDSLARAFINTPDYEMEVIKKRNDDGTVEKETVKPVEQFRKNFLRPILKEFGVDNEELKNLDDFEIQRVKALYPFMMELLFQYMKTGRQLDFIPKEDFEGSCQLEEIDEQIKEYKPPVTEQNPEPQSVRKCIEQHLVLKAKTRAPKNKKRDLK